MRLWSISPRYLDRRGLLAAWREGLLAQKVLEGRTRGYTNHPQLLRFSSTGYPLENIGKFLEDIYIEAEKRGYCFDRKKITLPAVMNPVSISVTSGQVEYEWVLLKYKLEKRDIEKFNELSAVRKPELNSIFRLIEGDIESWEKVKEEILSRML